MTSESLKVVTYRVDLSGWTGEPMRIVMVADLHACEPYMALPKVRQIIRQAQGLGGDLIALMGDYVGHSYFARPI
ncbi:MAG: metallophosphoesterase, partial [Pseudomonadota bacterium]